MLKRRRQQFISPEDRELVDRRAVEWLSQAGKKLGEDGLPFCELFGQMALDQQRSKTASDEDPPEVKALARQWADFELEPFKAIVLAVSLQHDTDGPEAAMHTAIMAAELALRWPEYRHARSLNWRLLTNIMVTGHESILAEQAGVPEDDQTEHALAIRDTVLEQLGEPRLIQAYIDCDYEMRTSDKDAVLDRALEVSGYNRVRAELFPESS